MSETRFVERMRIYFANGSENPAPAASDVAPSSWWVLGIRVEKRSHGFSVSHRSRSPRLEREDNGCSRAMLPPHADQFEPQGTFLGLFFVACRVFRLALPNKFVSSISPLLCFDWNVEHVIV